MTNLRDTTTTVLWHFFDAKSLFTSLDISNAVKKRMADHLVLHRQVAELVRELWRDDGVGRAVFGGDVDVGSPSRGYTRYTRTIISVHDWALGTTQAFLYHPADKDSREYSENKRRQRPRVPNLAGQEIRGA